MTDAEIIRHLAEKVMGWYSEECSCGKELRVLANGKGRHFNPLESIADALEVQGQLSPGQCKRYLSALESEWQACPCDCPWDAFLLTATARQRCLAMVEATR